LEIELSTLYWIPKFQKNQYLDRYIPGSSTCSTKELSISMTKIVHAVKGALLFLRNAACLAEKQQIPIA
jgi:hypothetical protein